MGNNDFLSRMEKVREGMAREGADVFLLGPSSDIFYLTGYGVKGDKRLLLLVLPLKGESFIIANLLYKEQVKNLPAGDFVYWKDGEDAYSLLKTEIAKRNITMNKAALEAQIPALFTLPLREVFPATEFILGSPIIDPLRQYKDGKELDLIRKACKESDRALNAVISQGAYWIGKTEVEFYDALSSEFNRSGLSYFGA